jgi:hypothetical protein
MQLVDSKLYISKLPALQIAHRRLRSGHDRNLVSRIKGTSAGERLLALMLASLVIVASPVLLDTVRSAVARALQILLEVVHVGFIAFQIFGR